MVLVGCCTQHARLPEQTSRLLIVGSLSGHGMLVRQVLDGCAVHVHTTTEAGKVKF